MKTTTYYLLGVGAAVGTVLFLILAIGALGIIGDGGRDDRMYLAVPAVLVLGTIVARLRAPGMSLALLATAATQVLVTVVALVAGRAGGRLDRRHPGHQRDVRRSVLPLRLALP